MQAEMVKKWHLHLSIILEMQDGQTCELLGKNKTYLYSILIILINSKDARFSHLEYVTIRYFWARAQLYDFRLG